MRSIPIIFSGWNHRAIIAFCRFCINNSVPFVIIAKDPLDPILLSDYKSNVFTIREDSTLSVHYFKKLYSDIVANTDDRLVLMPTTEYLNRFYLSNREELEGLGYVIPLCDSALYDMISDKAEFEKLCIKNNIATPAEYSEISKFRIPFVVKPRNYFFGGGNVVAEKPKLIMNEEDFNNLGTIDLKSYYCQEFVGGAAFYLLYYFAQDGGYSIYSQKNLVQQHGGLSIVAAEASLYHEDPRTESFTQLFLSVGFKGLVMVEVRDYNGKFYMIEANPRFWGPSQLILDSGMDLFAKFSKDNGLLSDVRREEYIPGTKYSWFGGIIGTSSLNESLAFHNGYTSEDYIRSISEWIKADVYKRKDTMLVFENELKQ